MGPNAERCVLHSGRVPDCASSSVSGPPERWADRESPFEPPHAPVASAPTVSPQNPIRTDQRWWGRLGHGVGAGTVADLDLIEARDVFAVNVDAPMAFVRSALPHMLSARSRRGAIINIASIAGKMSFGGSGVYSASKHAPLGCTGSLYEAERRYRGQCGRIGPCAAEPLDQTQDTRLKNRHGAARGLAEGFTRREQALDLTRPALQTGPQGRHETRRFSCPSVCATAHPPD
jgi:NAD(P)-dependent dehydrogenase (short-subunit alcohol dehydrogenase family)